VEVEVFFDLVEGYLELVGDRFERWSVWTYLRTASKLKDSDKLWGR